METLLLEVMVGSPRKRLQVLRDGKSYVVACQSWRETTLDREAVWSLIRTQIDLRMKPGVEDVEVSEAFLADSESFLCDYIGWKLPSVKERAEMMRIRVVGLIPLMDVSAFGEVL